jgi:ubiquinone/menaquinone biosynthesis C-methylase UbiE
MPSPPIICDADADQQFHEQVLELFPKSHEFEEHYVDHEIGHVGQMFASNLCPVGGKDVLEFGCNVGATSIILAHYGANVTAVDVNAEYVALAELNARRYGLGDRIAFRVLRPGEALPFADGSFDVITCNSVLEYVTPELLPAVQRELDRVLKPRGLLLVFGTSNRIWPVERHSRRWFVNYLPRPLDRFLPRAPARGVWPQTLCRGFGRGYGDLFAGSTGARRYIELKRQMGFAGWRLALMRRAAGIFAISPWSLGLMTPYATVLLRKSAPDVRGKHQGRSLGRKLALGACAKNK